MARVAATTEPGADLHLSDVESGTAAHRGEEEPRREGEEPRREEPGGELDRARMTRHLRLREERSRHYRRLPTAVVFYVVAFLVLLTKIDIRPSYEVQAGLIAKWGEHEKPDLETGQSPVQFANVGGVPDMWKWMHDRLVPEVFYQFAMDGTTALEFPGDARVLTYNKMLGGLRLHQGVAAEEPCANSDWDDFYGSCFPADTDGAGLWNETSVWLDDELTTAEAQAAVAEMRAASLVSEATRWAKVQLVVYNGEFDLYGRIVWRMDFHRGGRVQLRVEAATVPARPYEAWHAVVLDACFALSLVGICAEQLLGLLAALRRNALRGWLTVWVGVDVLIVACMCALVGQWATVASAAMGVFADDFEGEAYLEEVEILGDAMEVLLAFRVTGMFLMLLHCIRLLRFFTFQPRLALLTETLKAASGDLVHFFVLFFLIFISYVVAGMFIFGQQLEAFHSFSYSSSTCFGMLLGDFNYAEMRRVSGTGAALYFGSFMLLIAMVLLNMVLAIVMDAYSAVKERTGSDAESLGEELGAAAASVLAGWRGSRFCPAALKGALPVVPAAALRFVRDAPGGASPAGLAAALGVPESDAASFLRQIRKQYSKAPPEVDADRDGVPDELERRLDRIEAMLEKLLTPT